MLFGAYLRLQGAACPVIAFIDGSGLGVPVEEVHLGSGHSAGGKLDRSLYALLQGISEWVGVLVGHHFLSSSFPGCAGTAAAPRLAPGTENPPADPELARVVEAWAGLPDPIRRAILALVGAR